MKHNLIFLISFLKGVFNVQGHFITLEGGEGSGKTTVLDIVYNESSALGYSVLTTREPGGIPIAEKIRDIILDPINIQMEKKTEALSCIKECFCFFLHLILF